MDEHESNTTLEYSIYWLLAVEYQGERVINAWKVEEGQHYPFLNVRTMEEHFFLVALNKARRWLKKLEHILDDDTHIIEFLKNTDSANIVRNKREHDDEYFGSDKKCPKEPSHDVETESALKMNVGTSCSVCTEGKLLLGGIFDVHTGIQAAKSLQAILRKSQHAYWDGRALKPNACDHFKIPDRLIGP